MKLTLHKSFAVLLLLCTFAAALVLCAAAEVYDGTCGDDLTYTLDTDTGVLTISGVGEMTDNPWSTQKATIRTVILEDGVSSICNRAFYRCSNLQMLLCRTVSRLSIPVPFLIALALPRLLSLRV